jgi:hypothetical protein
VLDRTTELLARRMLDGATLPFRQYWRACGSLLNGDGTVSAAVAQQTSNGAVFGASATFGADVVPEQ